MPFFSVIVPVYNNEQYLQECLESIVHGGCSDIEIIVINDGSEDCSLDIALEIARKDSRIKVFTKTNGGVASARNFGISKATGEYLIFLDSDDLLIDNALSQAYSQLQNKNIDLVVCNSYVEMTENSKIVNNLFKKNILEKSLSYKDIKILCQNLSSMCIGIYRRGFINDNLLRVQEGISCAEDTDFFFEALLKASTIKIIECSLFAYRFNSMSVSNNLSYKSIKDVMKICGVRLQKLVESPSDQIDNKKALDFFATKYIHFSIKIANLKGAERKDLLTLMREDRRLIVFAEGKAEKLFVNMINIFGENITISLFDFLVKCRNLFTA